MAQRVAVRLGAAFGALTDSAWDLDSARELAYDNPQMKRMLPRISFIILVLAELWLLQASCRNGGKKTCTLDSARPGLHSRMTIPALPIPIWMPNFDPLS